MHSFYCIGRNGRVCGWVCGASPEEALQLAQEVDPEVDHLKPIC